MRVLSATIAWNVHAVKAAVFPMAALHAQIVAVVGVALPVPTAAIVRTRTDASMRGSATAVRTSQGSYV